MITELATLLLEATLATSAATVLVLLVRRPMRVRFGARCAYLLWLLLPLSLLAVALPARVETQRVADAASASVGAPLEAMGAAAEAPFDARLLVLVLWAFGGVATATALVRRQRRFRNTLGDLRRRDDGSFVAERADAGPAVIGVWRGRIVLPADFDTRFDAQEQDLVLRHERVHIARGDLLANLAAAASSCVFWFNPLLHYALGRFRFDQELAADAAVLAQRPDARRPYADAMLKTQLPSMTPPVGCHWQSAHPLKERIAMLKHPVSSPRRYAAGSLLVAIMGCAVAVAAWAGQTPQSRDAAAAGTSGTSASTQVRLYRGTTLLEEGQFSGGEGDRMQLSSGATSLSFHFERIATQQVTIAARLEHAGQVVAEPRLIAERGATASFAVDADAKTGAESLRVDFALAPLPRAIASPGAKDEPEIGATYNSLKPPRYPKPAIDAKAEGDVLLRVLVTADGRPEQVEVERSSGHPELDAAAIEGTRNWKFNPASNGHAAVPAWVLVPISFRLDGPPAEAAEPQPNTLDRIDIRGG